MTRVRLLTAALLALLCASALPHAEAATSTRQTPVCKRAPNGRVGCFAIRVDRYSAGRLRHGESPVGLTPADLRSAYALPTAGGKGMTVAIVDAYDAPTAEADLAVYRKQFGLPACTAARGCFRKVDQRGGRALPHADGGWAQEVSLDLDMASAVCP